MCPSLICWCLAPEGCLTPIGCLAHVVCLAPIGCGDTERRENE